MKICTPTFTNLLFRYHFDQECYFVVMCAVVNDHPCPLENVEVC